MMKRLSILILAVLLLASAGFTFREEAADNPAPVLMSVSDAASSVTSSDAVSIQEIFGLYLSLRGKALPAEGDFALRSEDADCTVRFYETPGLDGFGLRIWDNGTIRFFGEEGLADSNPIVYTPGEDRTEADALSRAIEALLYPAGKQEPAEEWIPEEPAEEQTQEEIILEWVPEEPAEEWVPEEPAEEQAQEEIIPEWAPEEPAGEPLPEESAEEWVPEAPAEEQTQEEITPEWVPEEPAGEPLPEEPAEEWVPEAPAEAEVPEGPAEEWIPEEEVPLAAPEEPAGEPLPEEAAEEPVLPTPMTVFTEEVREEEEQPEDASEEPSEEPAEDAAGEEQPASEDLGMYDLSAALGAAAVNVSPLAGMDAPLWAGETEHEGAGFAARYVMGYSQAELRWERWWSDASRTESVTEEEFENARAFYRAGMPGFTEGLSVGGNAAFYYEMNGDAALLWYDGARDLIFRIASYADGVALSGGAAGAASPWELIALAESVSG